MHFKDGQKLTIISVSDMLLTTVRREIKLTRTVDNRQAYVVRGKQKEYFLDITPDVLVFEGWGVPLVTLDTDTPIFITNKGYNFVTGSPDALREFIVKHNINEKFNQQHKVMYVRADDPQHTYRWLFELK